VTYASKCVVLVGFATLSVGMRGVFLRLEHERNTDALTGLRNWRSFLEVAEHELKDSSQSGSVVSLLTIDIDNFKQVNDILGHAAGDRLLVAIATCMRQIFRRTDCLGRLGGDEFAALLPGVSEPDAAVLLEKVRNRLLPVFERFGGTAGMSVGLVSTTDGGVSKIDELLARSDNLMYSAKRRRKVIDGCTEARSRHDAREMPEAVQTRVDIARPANHPRSAPNASDQFPNGSSNGPPDGPVSAHQ
jgi:diguanylate cyclase (GGDEF)-like protein